MSDLKILGNDKNNSLSILSNKYGSKAHHEHVITTGAKVPNGLVGNVWQSVNSNGNTHSLHYRMSDIRIEKLDFTTKVESDLCARNLVKSSFNNDIDYSNFKYLE